MWVSGHSESRELHTSDLLLPASLGAAATRNVGEARSDLSDADGAKRQTKQTWDDEIGRASCRERVCYPV